DQDFVGALLREVRTPDGRKSAAGTLARDREGGVLRLYQPVHRAFHVAVLEAFCDDTGRPRVDPRKVESAGMVVRRVVTVNGAPQVQGWMRDGDRIAGWMALGPRADLDPDARRRRPALRAGNPAVTALLRQADSAWNRWSETVSPLFVAPPDACADAGATLLYGVVPVTSSELTEQLAPAPQVDAQGVNAMLPDFLQKAGVHRLPRLKRAAKHKKTAAGDPNPPELALPDDEDERAAFLDALTQLARLRALDAFAPTAAGRAFVTLLNQVPVFSDGDGRQHGSLGDLLAAAARALEDDWQLGPDFTARWEIPSASAFGGDLRKRMEALLNAGLDALTAGSGRFERPDARYQVRAFVRLRRCDGCPPELVWSAPSEPFAIAPWYDHGGAPPVQIQLPGAKLSDMAKLKPNVAFRVPASVQDLLGGMKVKTPMEVEPGSLNLGLDWICGFSIPLITLCAFIVLSIFLMLLNIIFWWLPFIKICIPIPRVSASGRP
ncbi:MAG TPA: hypothetical protein VF541_06690, partial [Longimicrobium sp.]